MPAPNSPPSPSPAAAAPPPSASITPPLTAPPPPAATTSPPAAPSPSPTRQTSGTIAVTINGDTLFEPDETFLLDLANPTNGAVLTDGQGTGTISNDDAEPAGSIVIDDVTLSEGDAGTKLATFTVTRSGGTAAFSVDYATADGTATAGSDYLAASGTLSFADGVNTQTIAVTINGDTLFEPDETFLLNLSGPTNGAVITDGQGTATISNDDAEPAGSIIIDDVTLSEGDAGTKLATFTVTRSGGTAAFSVDYATADGTATAGSDYLAASGTLSFADGQTSGTIAVTINGDTLFEPDETFLLNLADPTNGAVLTDGQGTGHHLQR